MQHSSDPVPHEASSNSGLSVPRPSPPRITSKGWSVPELCRKYEKFQPVRRISALSPPDVIAKALEEYEQDGLPLIISDWHKHPKWPQDIFNLEWLIQTSGDTEIHVRNLHNRQDQSMSLSEFVKKSQSQSRYTVPGETERLYWKDADCPLEWKDWLLRSGAIPTSVLPASPDDYLGYLFPSEAVESLLCYMGIGDTYTASHKDLCASSGHNLMCFSEENASSFWFMTASNDAPRVAEYFQKKLKQELDWETHVTTVDELGNAPTTVYVAEQKVGDLVLVPPRSCHQVVNCGGLAMKTSWSRMTLDSLEKALHCELPVYRRVCRPEQYRVKTILYRSMLHLTKVLQQELGDYNSPSPELGTPEPSPSESVGKLAECGRKLRRLVQLFDEVLHEEYSSTHAEMKHMVSYESSAGWMVADGSAPDDNAAGPSSSSGGRLILRPPADQRERQEERYDRSRNESFTLACDFCGADIFQSFFECNRCREPEPGVEAQIGDGLLICPGCYVEGRSCLCDMLEPVQCRPFDTLVLDRNSAAKAISSVLPHEEHVETLEKSSILGKDDSYVFEAACALYLLRMQRLEKVTNFF
ncbi:hypothetical protein FKP32DRAFT_1611459 [Trametes sanguinea]|nr:hypothetical protein FKP32DRAFT_1611459 [Trametes sanguinea]